MAKESNSISNFKIIKTTYKNVEYSIKIPKAPPSKYALLSTEKVVLPHQGISSVFEDRFLQYVSMDAAEFQKKLKSFQQASKSEAIIDFLDLEIEKLFDIIIDDSGSDMITISQSSHKGNVLSMERFLILSESENNLSKFKKVESVEREVYTESVDIFNDTVVDSYYDLEISTYFQSLNDMAVVNNAPVAVNDIATIELAPESVIRFKNFSDTSILQLNGHAITINTTDGTVLRLVRNTPTQVGSVFSKNTVNADNFSTYFQFRMTNPGGYFDPVDNNGERGADGLVFVVQSVSSNLGINGGGIGYEGILNSVGVAFDTWRNTSQGDPSSNYLAIFTNGVVTHTINTPSINISPNFDDGNIWNVWVDYNGTTLEVRTSQNETRPENPTLETDLDLVSILGQDQAYVGFTSATGGAYENVYVLNWEYRDDYNPVTNIITGSLLGNDYDIDSAHALLSIATVNGAALNLGVEILLTSGALLTVNADGTYSYNENGAFSHLLPGETDTDSFTYQIKDEHGALSNTATVTIVINPASIAPVVFDLNNNNQIELISLSNSYAEFDINNDGIKERIAWVGSGDGILVYDHQQDGQVTDINEIAFTSYVPGAQTDLEGLRAFDSNQDGILDAQDDDYHLFYIWQDRNGNAIVDPDEMLSLADYGIVSLILQSDNQSAIIEGNLITGYTSYETADGNSHLAADIKLQISPSVDRIEMNEIFIESNQLDLSAVPDTTSESNEPSSDADNLTFNHADIEIIIDASSNLDDIARTVTKSECITYQLESSEQQNLLG